MNKKQYTSPVVSTVKLVSKNAILGFCHSSPNLFPKDSTIGCQFEQVGCANAPT
jgi:hypothetical protein